MWVVVWFGSSRRSRRTSRIWRSNNSSRMSRKTRSKEGKMEGRKEREEDSLNLKGGEKHEEIKGERRTYMYIQHKEQRR